MANVPRPSKAFEIMFNLRGVSPDKCVASSVCGQHFIFLIKSIRQECGEISEHCYAKTNQLLPSCCVAVTHR